MLLYGMVAVAGVMAASAANPLGPGSGPWVVETPEQHGVDSAALEAGKRELYKTGKTRNCYVVIKDGALIFEAGNSNKTHAAWSMTKTLGGLLMGHAVTYEGVDIDADITEKYHIPSPVDFPVTTREIMAQAVAGSQAGERWEYDAIGSKWLEKLPAVLQSALDQQGRNIKPSQLFDEELRQPLGLSNGFSWKPSPDKNWAAGAEGSCRDWARIGQLMLNKGKWATTNPEISEVIVSQDYIKDMTTPQEIPKHSGNYASSCYGLLTWLPSRPEIGYDAPCYMATDVEVTADRYMPKSLTDYFILGGIFGQNVVVIPEENMVVVSMGFTIPDLQGLTRNAQRMVTAAWCKGLGKNCDI